MDHLEKSKRRQSDTRESWSGRLEFILSCAGYCIGLGNIWRFPYLCYKNGGGTFLVPYIIFLLVGALPMHFLECALAQFSSRSPISIWAICPLMKGTGYGIVLFSIIVSTYFNVTMTWVIFFLYNSLTNVLPWSTCDNNWNTEFCYINEKANTDKNSSSLTNSSTMAMIAGRNKTYDHRSQNATLFTASEEFWRYKVLQLTSGIEDMGNVNVGLLICLCVAWLLTFICVCKGIKVSGKIVYVTVTLPYLLLTILLIRAVQLPGAGEGLKFYLIPKWDKLLSTQVWGEAALQIFYSLGAGWGTMLTYASYNHFHHNVYFDSVLMPFVNCGTSIFAGFVTFSMLGFMAQEKGIQVDKVVTQGPGLAFVTYPEALARLPVSPLWAVLFFLMLMMVAIDTQIGHMETISGSLIDEFPHFLRRRKVQLVAAVCLIEFVLGLPLIMQGGIYVFQIIDWYCALLSLFGFSIIECVVVGWLYGTTRFYKDIELMIGYKPNALWSLTWKYTSPGLLVIVLIFNMITVRPVSYKNYTYPAWAVMIGWIIGCFSLVPIPLYIGLKLWKTNGSLREAIQYSLVPSEAWGPALEKHRAIYETALKYSGGDVDKNKEIGQMELENLYDDSKGK